MPEFGCGAADVGPEARFWSLTRRAIRGNVRGILSQSRKFAAINGNGALAYCGTNRVAGQRGLASKRIAGVLAWWVPGVRDVINGIAEEQEEEDHAGHVAEALRLVLEKDPFVNASQIRIGARKTVVRLTGLVPSEAERDMAERDAWYVFGVDGVENLIEVEPVPAPSE